MGGVSEIIQHVQLPLEIKVAPYLMDHQFKGKAVLPAVEAMQVLAASTKAWRPELNVCALADARFSRFLYLHPDMPSIPAMNDMALYGDGRVVSTLLTRTRSKRAGITRTHAHVRLEFPCDPKDPTLPPADELFALEGIGLNIRSDEIYRSLVPFGPSFQNIAGELTLTYQGAVATVRAPDHGAAGYPLGSLFPLDAAFHAACVYGQRYLGIVGFPVGFTYRHLFRLTVPGNTYLTRIILRKSAPDRPVFDIWITDRGGTLHEAVLGVTMQDVSGGETKPPKWIRADRTAENDVPFSDGAVSCVMELSSVKGAGVKALSRGEHERFEKLGERRQKSFLAARLCLKRLSRVLSDGDAMTPASFIHTMASDAIRPRCPLTDGADSGFCSVSHDKRFVIAVASGSRVGVDVEQSTERLVYARRIYMNDEEKALTERSPLGMRGASLRIWSIKEAMAKAFGMTLAESWDRVAVKEIGETQCRVFLEENEYVAIHHQVADHMFTLVDTGCGT
ncbi:MAG: polyketide synthase dehydratase domain-containing protein [Deltaproteobacteria bacterium]|nr:polyketide synthase dehydratase domain-containing protein [Deltaproteobacteria bacterium]